MKARGIALSVLLAISTIASAASDPVAQAKKLYFAIHKQDWHALYFLAAFSPAVKKQLKGADKFAADVQKGFTSSKDSDSVKKLLDSISNIRVGAATIKGSTAQVPTKADIIVGGKKMHFGGIANMINDHGTWKWDLSYTDNVESATAQQIQKLLGGRVK